MNLPSVLQYRAGRSISAIWNYDCRWVVADVISVEFVRSIEATSRGTNGECLCVELQIGTEVAAQRATSFFNLQRLVSSRNVKFGFRANQTLPIDRVNPVNVWDAARFTHASLADGQLLSIHLVVGSHSTLWLRSSFLDYGLPAELGSPSSATEHDPSPSQRESILTSPDGISWNGENRITNRVPPARRSVPPPPATTPVVAEPKPPAPRQPDPGPSRKIRF